MGSLFGRLVVMKGCKWFICRFQACALVSPTPRNFRRRELVVVRVVTTVSIRSFC